jgi:trimeric autotransporter adhesin
MRLQKLLALTLVVIAPLAARAQTISTVAGGGPVNITPPNAASVGAPAAVRQDSLGNIYILDNNYGRVYKIDHVTHEMSVFAGNGTTGYNGDNIPAVNAEMSGPSGMCIDASDNVYVADSDNAIVREILVTAVAGKTVGNIYTVAGVEAENDFTYGGDGGPATSANLYFPDGCSFDTHGNLFIADRGNNAIRVVIGAAGVAPAGLPPGDNVPANIYLFTGSVPTPGNAPAAGYAPNGTATVGAALNGPFDVFVDGHDNVFISDYGNNFQHNPLLPANNNVIREVPATAQVFPIAMVAGHIYTIAGSPGLYGHTTGVPAIGALLSGAIGIYVDASGNLFFADQGNQVIREVPAVAATGMTPGDIYDVAGSGQRGYAGDGGLAINASFSFPAGTYVDSTGEIYIADSSSDAIRLVTSNTANYQTETISTFAGNGHFSFANAAPATSGQINTPAGIYVDSNGDLLIADQQNSLIREVASPISTGSLSTLTGEPEFNGFEGDPAPATGSVENNAIGVFTDPSGNVFVADTGNCIVRKISGGNIVTVAGTDPGGVAPATVPVCGFAGAGGPATGATIGQVNAVTVDANGNLFFSDSTNNIVWEVAKNTTSTMTAGNIYVAVGTQQTTGSFGGDGGPATGAQLNKPTGLYFDIFGNLFIADTGNNLIREVPANNVTSPSAMTAGNIYTVAGNSGEGAGFSGDGSSAIGAQLSAPFTMVVDHAGNIFIADSNNQVLREVTASNGKINTVAGTPKTAGFGGDGGPATSAQMNTPEGLALDAAGDLLVADSMNNRVRSITTLANLGAVPVASFNQTSITFLAELVSTTSAAQTVTLTNIGGASMTGIAISITGANAGDFSQTNTCTATLTAGSFCTISVKFTPSANGPRTAAVSIADNAIGSPQLVDLNGTGGAPTATLNFHSLTFTSQLVGTTSAAQSFTVTNTGNVGLTITSIAIDGTDGGDFAQTNNCPKSPAALATSAFCTVNVTFKPTAPGSRTASVTLMDNAADSPQAVSLTGTAIAPIVSFNMPSLTFTNQQVGTTSTGQAITLTNTGLATLHISNIAITGTNAGDFGQTNTCGTTLAASLNCTITVTFSPSATGTRTAAVAVTDDAAGSPQTVNLTGTGAVPVASFNPNSLTFANQNLGTNSTAQTITLSNTGGASMTGIAISITGTNAGDFAQTNTCGTSVAANANCTISVTFTPSATGARSASVTVTDNASGSPQAIALTGTGVAPMVSFSSNSVTFPDQFVGTSSGTAQTVTLTNKGTAALTIPANGITLTGTNVGDFVQTNTCGTSVAAGANCTISVNFTPSASGARSASVTITDNASPNGASTTQTITLGGNGFTVSLGAASGGSMSQTVQPGQTATYSLQYTVSGGAASDTANVSIACSGAPSLVTLTCPSSATAPGTLSVTAATTGPAMLAPQAQPEQKMQPPAALRHLPLTLLAVLLFIAAMLAWMQNNPAVRVRTVRFALAACLILLPMSATAFLAGCGGGSSSAPAPTPTPAPTPQTAAGTYTLTVTSTVNGQAQTAQLTLVVQ